MDNHKKNNYELLKDIEIDEFYVINMLKDVHRKKNMEETIEKYSLNKISKKLTIVEAVDWTGKNSPNSFNGPRNGGAYGCTMSHLKCVKDAETKKHDIILISEDDLMIHKDFAKIWNSTYIPKNWEILYLSSTQLKWGDIQLKPYNSFYKGKKSLGGTCYILKRSMFNVIQNLYNVYKKPIDELLVIAQEKHSSLVLYPNLCINYMNESNIRKNNTWAIETTSKRLKWDISLYDTSIILKDQTN